MSIVNYTPPPTVSAFMQSRAIIRGMIGPLGSGKSVGCVMGLVKNAMEQEPDDKGIRRSRFAVIRNTYRMLSDTTINTVFDWLPNGVAGEYKAGQNKFLLEFGDVKSEWLFRALDKPDDVRNLLSLEITSAWINEYREIDPDVLINLLGRIGRFPGKKKSRMRSILLDSNPPPMGSYWYDLFEEGLPDELQLTLDKTLAESTDGPRPLIEYFKQPGGKDDDAENIENLPDGYYDVLLAANAHRGEDWAKVHVHAQYGPDPSSLPVYPQYKADIHAPQPFPYLLNPEQTCYCGLDFGKSPAAVLFQQQPNDRWVAFSEITTENCVTEEFIPKLMAWLSRLDVHPADVIFYGDPAGGHQHEVNRTTSFQLLREAGLRVFPGERAPDRRHGAVRSLLTTLIEGVPALVIHRRECPVLHKGMAGEYKFKRNQAGEMQPEPLKNKFSHPADAMQHLLGKRHVVATGKPQDAILNTKAWNPLAARA